MGQQTVNGLTRTCGLIGNPVEHTLSPVIHNTLSEIRGINLCYLPFRVETDDVGKAVNGAFALNILGLNVTVPHKQNVLPYLTDIDPLAEKIGAVNTLVRTENGYKGYNTDMPGLYRAMRSDKIAVDGEQVLLIGAGGVARAAAVMLAEKCERIYILNRTVDKALKIAEEVNGYEGCERCVAMALSDYDKLPEGRFLAIQATNVGMYPNNSDTVIEDAAFYEKIHTCYDLIYNPFDTEFMKRTREAGGKAYNGLKMLLYQGIIAYELWNGIQISEQDAETVYTKLKESL